ncbi:MAG: right-handed parallel beta-helix repeat-containing protein, partial [Pseudomonadota bacterium]
MEAGMRISARKRSRRGVLGGLRRLLGGSQRAPLLRRLVLIVAVALAGMVWSGTLRSSAPIAAETVAVADARALSRALDAAQGGETLLLAPGDYGELILKKRAFSPPVTLAASPEGAVRFARIELVQSSGLTLVGLTLAKDLKASEKSRMLTVRGCRIGLDGAYGTAVYMRDVQDLVLEDNQIRAGRHGVILNAVTRAVLRGNSVREAREDLLRITGRSQEILIENNALIDVTAKRPAHPDLIQIFGYEGNTPHDLTIRGNLLYDDPSTGEIYGQGIFMTDPHGGGYRNI